MSGALYLRPVIQSFGTRNLCSASTVDQMPKHVSSGLLFGDPGAMPVPDLDRTDYLLMLGANPWESNGSLCTAPDFPGRVKAIQERGGKVVVVDPRRTRTADEADEHVAIRPGTDAHLLLAMVNVLFDEGLVDAGAAGAHSDGLDDLPDAVAAFTPEAVAAGHRRRRRRHPPPRPRDRRGARPPSSTAASAPTPSRSARSPPGPSTSSTSSPATSTRPAGPCSRWPPTAAGGATRAAAGASPPVAGPAGCGSFPEVRGEIPVATLADEMETPGEGQVRALVTVAGNPVLSTPDGGRLDAALEHLDFTWPSTRTSTRPPATPT